MVDTLAESLLGEKRLLMVLFSDLVGFTELSLSLDLRTTPK